MTSATWVLLALAAGAAGADWVAVQWKRKPLEYAAKPATLAALTAAAVALSPHDPVRRWWFVAALALSLLGDVFLMLEQDLFVAGLASFLLGHLCFIVGLLHRGGSLGRDGLALVAVLALGAFPAQRILGSVLSADKALAGPVAVYMTVISVMVALAVAGGNAVAGMAAALFFVSDTSLAWNRFVKEFKAGPMTVIVTYHLAQALFVVSLLR